MILLKVQRAAPGRIEILTALARVLLLDGDYADAADTYHRVLALHPEDALTRADLAACQLEAGERSAGEANLRMACAVVPICSAEPPTLWCNHRTAGSSSGKARLRNSCKLGGRNRLHPEFPPIGSRFTRDRFRQLVHPHSLLRRERSRLRRPFFSFHRNALGDRRAF
jgi:hypothetical protein